MINWTFAREIGVPRYFIRMARRQIDKRVLRRNSRMRLPSGAPIILPIASHSASEVFVAAADIDWGAEKLFARFAERDADMFDIGAHIGYYGMYLSPLVRRVFAFEPDPRNLSALRANAALVDNVEVVAQPVSNRTGPVHFDATEGSEVSRVGTSGAVLQAVSVDDFVAQTGARPRLIKIDVEGHDLEVVEGARQTIATLEPLIVIEFFSQDSTEESRDHLFDLADALGYSIAATVWTGGSLLNRRSSKVTLLDRASLATTRTKMLFLVPPRLRAAFESAAR